MAGRIPSRISGFTALPTTTSRCVSRGGDNKQSDAVYMHRQLCQTALRNLTLGRTPRLDVGGVGGWHRQDTSRRRSGRASVPPVATRAPDASRGRSRWPATGRGSAAPSAALATPRLPSSATGTARICSRERPAAAALSPCFQVTVTHPSNCSTVRIFWVTGRSRTIFGPATAEASNDAGGRGLYSPSIVRNLPA